MSFLHAPGDLSETPLAALLLEALDLRASGVLAVEHGGGTSRLFFREGRPVGAQVFTGFRPLGHMLLQAGLIDIDALSRSLARMAETGRPQGELLVELGSVSRADVDRMLAEQQAGYFGLIAELERGAFRFDPAIEIPAWTRATLLSPLRTIVEALERPQAGALVVSALQQVATSGVALAPAYAEVEGEFGWSPAERVLVARLMRPVELEGFFAPSDVPPERARAILSALVLLGVTTASAREGTQSFALAPAETPALRPEPEPEREPAPPARDPCPVAPGPWPVTSSRSSTPTSTSTSTSTSPARRADPAEARARRQRLLHQAMKNMGVGPFGAGARDTPSPSAATPTPTPTPTAATPAPAGSAEDAVRRALLAIAPRAKERDLFVRLGVSETATRDDVKKAFLALARQFHPDRFASPALADLADTVREFFTAVNEAYEVLSDDRKRAEYAVKRAAGKAAAGGNPEAARVDFEKAEACLRTRDFARARGFYEAAIRADPRAEYQAALAFALLTDPQRRDAERARKLLQDAVRDRSCDRAQFVAGLLARDDGDDRRAEALFRAAAAANPRNADAARELRALEARRRGR